jgi:hypothetical protein
VSENAPFGWTAQVGSLTITDTSVDIVIDDNDAAEDLYRVTARAPMLNATFPGVDSVIMVINLRDPDGDVFTSDALPLTPPNLALFSGTKRIYLAGFPEGGGSSLFDVMATVTTLVPEPSSALLLGGGLIALASGRRAVRQRR